MNSKIRFAINCRDNDLAWWYPHRSIDFLVDGKTITGENTILIAENPVDPQYETTGTPAKFRAIPTIAEKRPRFLPHPLWWIYLRIKYPKLESVVFGLSTGRGAIWRNKFLNVCGIRTWFYSHSGNWPNMFGIKTHNYFQGLNYSDYIVWDRRQADFLIDNGCNLNGEFHVVGPLFTEYAARNRSDNPSGMYFYDTSFNNGITTSEEYLAFLKYVEMFKWEHPDRQVHLKLKNPLFPGQADQVDVPYSRWGEIPTYTVKWSDPDGKIRKQFCRLEKVGIRILLPSSDNDDILCIADEIIAMPYTSIVLEAAALGIKTEWWGSSQQDPKRYLHFKDCDGIRRFREALLRGET